MVEDNSKKFNKNIITTELLIAGGGTGGIAAAIQAARLGIDVTIVSETRWLGGMLTSAGVSCIDGNYELPAGIFGEFRENLFDYYGNAENLKTGWVSHVNFEPHVANDILHEMAKPYENLKIYYEFEFHSLEVERRKIQTVNFRNSANKIIQFQPAIVIEATEFGDLAEAAGCKYQLGIDGPNYAEHNPHVQDLTWVAILKKYKNSKDSLISKPNSYDPAEFHGCCEETSTSEYPSDIQADRMLSYGKLPNNKYMLNWPIRGNDYYASVFDLTQDERQEVWEQAKEYTLNMLYFIQNELGYKNIGLADEFPSDDKLALIPYNRESRRFAGYTRLKIDHILQPYNYELYKRGIAVGDYPIDHHHSRNPEKIEESFPPIPSFTVPYDCLISSDIDNIILAEKNISVSHVVNGSTRLQPVVMQMGQAAGISAAISIENSILPKNLNIRYLQKILLDNGGYLMPFVDVTKDDDAFEAVQRTAVAGLFQGEGVPDKWANKTYFHPAEIVTARDFELIKSELLNSKIQPDTEIDESPVDPADIIDFLRKEVKQTLDYDDRYLTSKSITRKELACLLDKNLNLFSKPIYINRKGKR